MENFKQISENSYDQIPSDRVAQVGNLPDKTAGMNMLDEVTQHFKTTFSNVSKGEASAAEYLEVGALAVGTAALATVGIGKLMQRSFPTLQLTEGGLFAPKASSANAANIDRILKASETLPHPISGRVREAALVRSEAAVFPVKPINAGADILPPGPASDVAMIVNTSANAPSKTRLAAFTDDSLPGLVSRLERTPTNKLTINLEGSRVTDEGLRHLLPLQGRVKEMNLAGTRITTDARLWLGQNFPDASLVLPSRRDMKVNALLRSIETGAK